MKPSLLVMIALRSRVVRNSSVPAIVVSLAFSGPSMAGTINTFFQNAALNSSGNWTGGAVNSSGSAGAFTDFVFTSPTLALTSSATYIYGESYNVTNGSSYTIQGNSGTIGTIFRMGNTGTSDSGSFANAVSGLANDMVYLSNNSNLSFLAVNSLGGPIPTVQLRQSGNLNISSGSTLTINQVVDANSSSYGITKTGAGLVVLGASNLYAGGTTIANGTLRYAADNVSADEGTITVSGGTFDLQTYSDTVGAVTLSSGTIDGSGTLTGSSFSMTGTGTVNAALAGASSLTKNNAGTVSLNNQNTYSGGTTISGGTLALGHATDTLADAGAVLVSGGTLDLGANSDTVGAVTMSSGSITGAGTLTGTGYELSGSGTVSASLGGTGTLTKSGVGTVFITGTNSYTDITTISGGTLNVTNFANAGSDSGLGNNTTAASRLVINGGTLQHDAANIAITNRRFTVGPDGATIDSSAAAATDTLSFTQTGSLGASGGAGDRTLTLTGSNTGENTLSSAIIDVTSVGGGVTGLAKTGSGTWVLDGGNTYTGETSVDSGKLVVNGNSSTATGNVSVASGAVLAGIGTVGGSTTIDGILAPGNSIGTLTIANAVTWSGAASASSAADWQFELGIGNTSDLLSITGGDFNKGAGAVFRFDFIGGTDAGTFTLVDWTGGTTDFSAADFSYTNLGGGNTGPFSVDGSQLTFTVVPEPAAALLGGVGMLFLLRRRRAA